MTTKNFHAHVGNWSVYINTPTELVEVFYVSAPLLDRNNELIPDQKKRLQSALESAKVIAERFEADGRLDATRRDIKNAFNREFEV